ncbi:Gaa1-domain-containing protein, partial [Meira miltonrushii]
FLLPIPEKPFRRNVYVDENALQPGSATVEWGWGEVEFADRLADRIRSVQDKRDEDRAELISTIFQEIGLTPYKQHYTFHTPSRSISGINSYARWSSARGDGREAFIIAVPWKNSKDGSLSAYQKKKIRRTNVRGIATALTIAKFLSGYRHWSKDLIFVIADDELHGMQAFTSQYFGRHQNNLDCEELQTRGALVWNALSIDYPSDSFSGIILKHEGLNGQLPNLDVISTLTNVMYRADGLPVELNDATEDDWEERPWGEVGDLLEKHLLQSGDGTRKYLSGLWNMFGQISRLTIGRPTGVHGLFHRYHVDAITIFASPAQGPYGFWHMGRTVESVTRSMSNLLERLHHSHFFYILTSPERFIEVTKYLPVAILFGVALLIAGIALWVDEG